MNLLNATKNGKTEEIKLLLENGTDVNFKRFNFFILDNNNRINIKKINYMIIKFNG